MQTRREFLVQTGALAAGSLVVGAPALVRAQQKMVLKAADVHALGYPTVEAIVRMGKKLEAATNGRLDADSLTVGGASCGNCAIGSVGIAMAPARMITSEHTLARMGRLIKVSTTMAYGLGLRAQGLGPSGAGATGAPSTSFCEPEMTTFSPGLIPSSTG